MKAFFAPNIGRKGRIVRGVLGLAMLAVAAFMHSQSVWLAIFIAAVGVFCLVEAFRGWCLARACGIRTRL